MQKLSLLGGDRLCRICIAQPLPSASPARAGLTAEAASPRRGRDHSPWMRYANDFVSRGHPSTDELLLHAGSQLDHQVVDSAAASQANDDVICQQWQEASMPTPGR
jgi:hypothetical protein